MNTDLNIEECTTVEAISCGFKQDWISGGNDDVKFEMTSGAGLGNPWLQIQITKDGETKNYRANMGEFLQNFVSQQLAP